MQVRSSGPGRGNGAFAVREIAEGVCLGAYEGELIDEATYWARYPSGRVWALIAAEQASQSILCCSAGARMYRRSTQGGCFVFTASL